MPENARAMRPEAWDANALLRGSSVLGGEDQNLYQATLPAGGEVAMWPPMMHKSEPELPARPCPVTPPAEPDVRISQGDYGSVWPWCVWGAPGAVRQRQSSPSTRRQRESARFPRPRSSSTHAAERADRLGTVQRCRACGPGPGRPMDPRPGDSQRNTPRWRHPSERA